jgi:hypothetical protein
MADERDIKSASKDVMAEGCTCHECGKVFKVDLILQDELWAKISPKKVEGFKGGGLLCPVCIGRKLEGLNE